MTDITSHRRVKLIDNRAVPKSIITAGVYQGFFPHQLEEVEASWADARERAVTEGRTMGFAPLEHSHWDWRRKADSMEAGHHVLVAVEVDTEVQGLMAVLQRPRPARLGDGYVIYVDFLESAPWNLKSFVELPRYLGVGTVLMSEAVRMSVQAGTEGRVGLHFLPQAEGFYEKCKLTRVGEDPTYYDLVYFEYHGRDAMDWLVSIGDSP